MSLITFLPQYVYSTQCTRAVLSSVACSLAWNIDSHVSVHRKYISKLQPARWNVSWFIYFYRRSTGFRRFLRSSSGAHNSTYSFKYCQPILLLAASMEEMEQGRTCLLTACEQEQTRSHFPQFLESS